MSLSNAKVLATGCRLYADDHDGRFPNHLSELVPDYLSQADLDKNGYLFRASEDDPVILMDWLYFGAGFDETNAPPLLIASPQATAPDGKKQSRVIVAPDTSGMVIREAQYQEKLKETIKRMQSLDENRRLKTPPVATPVPVGK